VSADTHPMRPVSKLVIAVGGTDRAEAYRTLLRGSGHPSAEPDHPSRTMHSRADTPVHLDTPVHINTPVNATPTSRAGH
jgi:hypothetical protein